MGTVGGVRLEKRGKKILRKKSFQGLILNNIKSKTRPEQEARNAERGKEKNVPDKHSKASSRGKTEELDRRKNLRRTL